jgi:FdrA protein
VALGFANAVPRGPVGLVGAAGTGLQAVTSGLARAGVGISQAIGTGGRDLSEAVGGRMMLAGLAALQADPETQVIVLVSKPPAPAVAEAILARLGGSAKPAVVCFLGAEPGAIERGGAYPAATLSQAAALGAALARSEQSAAALKVAEQAVSMGQGLLPSEAARLRPRLAPEQRYVRGLFAGGTFCYEAQLVLRPLIGPVTGNAPLEKALRLADSQHSVGHTCVDLGEDEFTQGRLHPMIDPAARNRRIVQEAQDPATAVILLDLVLGFGAHPDPAGATTPAIREAHRVAEEQGRQIIFLASVCGTEDDPQPVSRQEEILRRAGCVILPDNAAAAHLAGLILTVEDREATAICGEDNV